MSETLTFERVEIALAGRPLIGLDRSIAPGEVLTVMGPSGVGKSSLLAYAAGFLDPAFEARGRVLSGNAEVTGQVPHLRRLGLLFQDPLLFPHLDVGANLAFALAPELKGRSARRAAVATALSEVELDGFASRDPATLSGGQKARVALMRVLLARPRALLLDEPFSKLDAALRGQIRHLVFSKARENRLPILLVTHDIADAEAAGGPVVDLTLSA